MKKVIRLTESELIRVIKRIVKESEEFDGEEYMNYLIEKGCSNMQAYYLTQLEISDDLNWKSMFETYGEDIVNELFSNDYHNFLDLVFQINQYAEDKPLSFIYRRWDGSHEDMINILTEYFFKGDKKLMIEKYGEYLEREIKDKRWYILQEFSMSRVVNIELMIYQSYRKYKNDWRDFEEFMLNDIEGVYDRYGGYVEPFNTYSPYELTDILYDSPIR